MASNLERCRYCGAVIPEGSTAVVYGDNNRKYCSESCARAQLDREQGHAVHRDAEWDSVAVDNAPLAGDRVGSDRGPAKPRSGPTMR